MFLEDNCDLPPECGLAFGDSGGLVFLSAKQVRELLEDEAQMVAMFFCTAC